MKAGDRVANRFELVELAGAGGMGTVFLAKDLARGTRVALKVLHDLRWRERFEREARILSTLSHPTIVRYVEHDTGAETPYLAMEWLEGVDLASRLKHGPLSIDESVELLRALAEALVVAHGAGVTHRDLKPTNVFLVGGDLKRPKLLDFGLALADQLSRMTETGARLGTPSYMAPEQARGEPVDARSDLFALGCVLFACVTGRDAFYGATVMGVLARILFDEPPGLRELVPTAPRWLEALARRMLAKSPNERPESARALLDELHAGELGDTLPPPPSMVDRGPGISGAESRYLTVLLMRPSDELRAPIGDLASATGASVFPLVDGSCLVLQEGRGAPLEKAQRAAQCALRLREITPGMHIAVASGRAELDRAELVGSAVDRAALMLRRAEETSVPRPAVLLDEVTRGFLDASYEHRRHDGSELVVLIGRREVDSARRLLGKPTPCVGRERELGTLTAVLEEAIEEPSARAAIVTGVAGIGKSRLRHELVQRLRTIAPDAEVWFARADPVGQNSPFALAAQALRRAAGIRAGEPRALQRDQLAAWIHRTVSPSAAVATSDALGDMIGLSAGDTELNGPRPDVVDAGDRIRRAWSELVVAQTSARPLILMLDDLQWGDGPTVQLVDQMLGSIAEGPLAVIAFARPEVDQLFPDLWARRSQLRISLAPLGKKASRRLAQSALGEGVDGALVDRIVEHAAGNAFYLEELIRFTAEGGADALPETVVAMATARLEALPPEARRVLRAASVFGHVAWVEGIVAVAGLREATTLSWLERLGELELLTPRRESKFASTREVEFRHAIVREAAYAMLTEASREVGHRLAGDWLERAGELDAMVLAEHWSRGGVADRARAAYARAASQALEGADYAGARARAQRGIDHGATGAELGSLTRLAAKAASLTMAGADALALSREALALLPEDEEEWCEAGGIFAVACYHTDRIADLEPIARHVQRILRGEGPKLPHLRLAARIAAELVGGSLGPLGLELLADLAKWPAAQADPAVQARVHRCGARTALNLGDWLAYMECSRLARPCFEAAGERRAAFVQSLNVLNGCVELALFEGGEHEARALVERLDKGASDLDRGLTTNLLGRMLLGLGRLDEAKALAAPAFELLRRAGATRHAGHAAIDLALIHRALGDHAEEARAAELAAMIYAGLPSTLPLAEAVLSRARLASGDREAASALATRALDRLTELGHLEYGDIVIRLAYVEASVATEAGGRLEAMSAKARDVLATARAELLAQASKIPDLAVREGFLARIEWHASTLSLARTLALATTGDISRAESLIT